MVMLPLFDLCPRRGTRRERAVALGKLYRLSALARQRSGIASMSAESLPLRSLIGER